MDFHNKRGIKKDIKRIFCDMKKFQWTVCQGLAKLPSLNKNGLQFD